MPYRSSSICEVDVVKPMCYMAMTTASVMDEMAWSARLRFIRNRNGVYYARPPVRRKEGSSESRLRKPFICQRKTCWVACQSKNRLNYLVDRTHFSKTTPSTSSTSPLSPFPVILASVSAARRRCSAAVTTSTFAPTYPDP